MTSSLWKWIRTTFWDDVNVGGRVELQKRPRLVSEMVAPSKIFDNSKKHDEFTSATSKSLLNAAALRFQGHDLKCSGLPQRAPQTNTKSKDFAYSVKKRQHSRRRSFMFADLLDKYMELSPLTAYISDFAVCLCLSLSVHACLSPPPRCICTCLSVRVSWCICPCLSQCICPWLSVCLSPVSYTHLTLPTIDDV